MMGPGLNDMVTGTWWGLSPAISVLQLAVILRGFAVHGSKGTFCRVLCTPLIACGADSTDICLFIDFAKLPNCLMVNACRPTNNFCSTNIYLYSLMRGHVYHDLQQTEAAIPFSQFHNHLKFKD